MKRYLILALVAALSAGAAAQSDDKAYCDALGGLASRYVRTCRRRRRIGGRPQRAGGDH